MKKIALAITSALLVFGMLSFTGKEKPTPSFEGIITYSVTNLAATDQQKAMMAGVTVVMYYKGDMIKKVQKSPYGEFAMITNVKKREDFICLQEFTGHKYLQILTDSGRAGLKRNLDKAIKENRKIVYLDSTKNILGYACSKALVKLVFNKDTSISTVYYADKLPNMEDGTGVEYLPLKGLPLQYEQKMSPMLDLQYTAISVVRQSLSDSTFIPSKDYIPATHEEIMLKIREFRTGTKPDDDMKN
ncbi:MAG TPA: hypothetical protein VNZ45_16360 [Bacteroidia bacterium]|jgi:hypothetical protein|nr:hypothetical protein [Bacteroidia bacterium]